MGQRGGRELAQVAAAEVEAVGGTVGTADDRRLAEVTGEQSSMDHHKLVGHNAEDTETWILLGGTRC